MTILKRVKRVSYLKNERESIGKGGEYFISPRQKVYVDIITGQMHKRKLTFLTLVVSLFPLQLNPFVLSVQSSG